MASPIRVKMEARSTGGATSVKQNISWFGRLKHNVRLFCQSSVDLTKKETMEIFGLVPSAIQAFACSPVQEAFAFTRSPHIVEVRLGATPQVNLPVLKADKQRDVLSLAWSPAVPRCLAVGCMEGLLIWNIAQNLASVPTYQFLPCPPVCDLSFSPSGLYLAATSAAEAAIRVWDLKDNSCQLFHCGRTRLVRWSPDGSRLFFSGQGAWFGFLDTTTGRTEMRTAEQPVTAAAWAAEGKALLYACSGTLRCLLIQESLEYTLYDEAEATHKSVVSLAASSNNRIALVYNADGQHKALTFRLNVAASLASLSEGKLQHTHLPVLSAHFGVQAGNRDLLALVTAQNASESCVEFPAL